MEIKLNVVLMGECGFDVAINKDTLDHIARNTFGEFDTFKVNHKEIGNTTITEIAVNDPCDYDVRNIIQKVKQEFTAHQFLSEGTTDYTTVEAIDMNLSIETQTRKIKLDYNGGSW